MDVKPIQLWYTKPKEEKLFIGILQKLELCEVPFLDSLSLPF